MALNPDIVALRLYLRDTIRTLILAQDATQDIEVFRRLGSQIRELEHRSMMLGRVEFAAATDALARKLEPIKAGQAELDAAIEELEKLAKFLQTMSKFLGLVDKVIDVLT